MLIKNSLTVLLIEDSPTYAKLVRGWLSKESDIEFPLIWTDSLVAGLNRLAEGGVDAILLDLGLPESNGPATFAAVEMHASGVPIVILSGEDAESLALQLVQQGAQDYIIKQTCTRDLLVKALKYAVLRSSHSSQAATRSDRGTVIGLMGAKGGVGTTTIALNVASALASRSKVILVEMRPTLGTLALHLQPQGLTRCLSHLLDPESGADAFTKIESSLWSYPKLPGLRILFGPQTAEECTEINPEQVKAIIQSLVWLADYVIVDLPASLSNANRAVIENSNSIALVVERDLVCARAARLMARAIESWSGAPQPIGAIIVNRAAPNSPMPISEINTLIGCQVLGMIPPNADLCLKSQIAHSPLVTLDSESLLASSLNALAEVLAPAQPNVPPRG
jgi:Flp pilus assembly CpaE family ATPase